MLAELVFHVTNEAGEKIFAIWGYQLGAFASLALIGYSIIGLEMRSAANKRGLAKLRKGFEELEEWANQRTDQLRTHSLEAEAKHHELKLEVAELQAEAKESEIARRALLHQKGLS